VVVKGVLYPLNIISGEGYHIEPAIHSVKTPIVPGKPQTRGLQQSQLFLPGNAGRSAAECRRFAVANFNEDRRRPVFHYQINFAATGMHVGGDKTQSFAFQPAMRAYFPRLAGLFTR